MCLSSSTRLRALLADVSTRFGKKLRVRTTGRRWFLPISKETKTRELSTLTRSATPPLSLCSTGYCSFFPSTQDLATPIKFNGRQYKESLLFFVKVLFSLSSHPSNNPKIPIPALPLLTSPMLWKRFAFPFLLSSLSSSPSGAAPSIITSSPR